MKYDEIQFETAEEKPYIILTKIGFQGYDLLFLIDSLTELKRRLAKEDHTPGTDNYIAAIDRFIEKFEKALQTTVPQDLDK